MKVISKLKLNLMQHSCLYDRIVIIFFKLFCFLVIFVVIVVEKCCWKKLLTSRNSLIKGTYFNSHEKEGGKIQRKWKLNWFKKMFSQPKGIITRASKINFPVGILQRLHLNILLCCSSLVEQVQEDKWQPAQWSKKTVQIRVMYFASL